MAHPFLGRILKVTIRSSTSKLASSRGGGTGDENCEGGTGKKSNRGTRSAPGMVKKTEANHLKPILKVTIRSSTSKLASSRGGATGLGIVEAAPGKNPTAGRGRHRGW